MAERLTTRVFVRGASTVGWSGRMGGARTELGFPRVLERELLARDHRAEVRSVTVGGMPTSAVLKRWEHDIVGWSPDVVVYMVGHYETLHVLWPNRLERHANHFRWLPRPLRTLYRRKVLRPVWRNLVRFQTAVDAHVPQRWAQRRVRYAVADLARAVKQAREIQSPLVVLMETPLPGSYARKLFPGMEVRVEAYNRMIAELADRLGEEVRVLPTNAVLGLHDLGARDDALPDGFHFSAPAHDAVGRALAELVQPWIERQPHLQPIEPHADAG
ncbi:SGNH/GDSL hydrolase family protein [Nocardioides sp.]|uniref:SGNH/GDSL hydrolase family protein n=1 Tax=Nocardioides sp. TaxID=35761 RepID=UPI003511E8D3